MLFRSDPSPEAAQQIADEIRNVASVHITNVMDIEAVNIVDYANYPREKASPSVGKWTLIGCALGMLLAIGVLVLKYILDDTVKTSEDVEKFLQMSTLAMIPMMDAEEAKKEKHRTDKLKGFGDDEEEMDVFEIK